MRVLPRTALWDGVMESILSHFNHVIYLIRVGLSLDLAWIIFSESVQSRLQNFAAAFVSFHKLLASLIAITQLQF